MITLQRNKTIEQLVIIAHHCNLENEQGNKTNHWSSISLRYLFKTRLIRPDLTVIDRLNLWDTLFSFSMGRFFSRVSVRLKIESVSNIIDETSSFNSGVGERLVVQAVDVFKPESVVMIVITLGMDGHGDDRRRTWFIEDLIWVIAGVERERFKHRHGNNDEVEWNSS